MEALLKLLARIPPDKIGHALAGVVIYTVSFFCLALLQLSIANAANFAFAIVMLIAALKELYDYFHPSHCADFWDWLATCLGGLVGVSNTVFCLFLSN